MKATDVLKQEHRVIEQVLDCLESMVARVDSGAELVSDDASAALDFFTTFADRCHHGKEEERLFPAMVKKGVPGDVGPVAVMLAEHDAGRSAVADMRAALGKHQHRTFARHARIYLELLRDHIAKEDNILFPMADSVLGQEQGELLVEFSRVETEELGVGLHEEMVAIADRLAASYGVALAANRSSGAFTGCCHQHEPSATPAGPTGIRAPRS